MAKNQVGISVERTTGVATITLSNPARKNALTVQMWAELASQIQLHDGRRDIRTIVITGAAGNFSSGVDLSYLRDCGTMIEPDPAEVTAQAELAIVTANTPVIASIAGYCLGGGTLVACAADLRIASSTAKFGLPPAKLGLVYPASSVRRLVALIGPARTKLLLFTAEVVDAATAFTIGLVDRVVPPGDLEEATRQLTDAISSGSALTQASTKRMAEMVVEHPAELEAERQKWHELALSTGELAEGIAAFGQKRNPSFPWSGGGP